LANASHSKASSSLHKRTANAVMEMCVDNRREEFTDLYSAHPSIAQRIKVLVDVAERARSGAVDAACRGVPGRNASLERSTERRGGNERCGLRPLGAVPAGPAAQGPYLPDRPSADLASAPAPLQGGDRAGPWG
jgi:hypothetical protein